MKTTAATKTKIGQGVLSWNRIERVSDRYGSITMNDANSMGSKIGNGHFGWDFAQLIKLTGTNGKLIIEVIGTRESTHIGDVFRGVFPKTPNVGEKFVLGEGVLFTEEGDGAVCVGVKPVDSREDNWMDINNLYNVHEQDVVVYFEEN